MHYVATLKVEKVDHGDPRTRVAEPSPKREIAEVAMITIKADSLASLVVRLGKHIDIIEEN